MAKYRVQGPDGAVHVFEGPDGASDDQVVQFAQQHFGAVQPTQQPAQQPKPHTAADDVGALQSIGIGAGRTTDNILDGLTQWLLHARGEDSALKALKAQNDYKAELYKPLQEAHPIATAVGEAVPGMVVPVGGSASVVGNLGRLALAGAAPGALEYGSIEDRAKRAAAGAAGGVVGGVVVPKLISAAAKAVPAVARTARALFDPLTDAGRSRVVGRTLNSAAGADAVPVAGRLAQAAPVVPGSIPTAAQVAENGGIAALERSAAARAPADFTTRSMEQAGARLQAVRGVAGDDAAMAAAKTARQTTTKPMYDGAFAKSVEVDPALQALLSRPSVQKAIARAEKIAQEDGRAFGLTAETQTPASALLNAAGQPMTPAATIPGKVTGQTLQDLKMGIDALLKDPTSGIAGKEADLIQTTRGQLLNWMENKLPELGKARTEYARLSKPVNQMQVGQELLQKIEPALNDYGQLASETANKYALALRNADQTARTATKFKGAGMADIMEPGQMQLLEGVATDLARKANADKLGRGSGSDTFQKLAMDNIAAQSGAPRVVGGALNLPGVSKVAKFLYAGPEEQIQSKLAQALMEPKNAAMLMKANPAQPPARSVRQFLFDNPSRTTQLLGGLGGLSTAEGARR